MSDYYFSKDPKVAHNEFQFEFDLLGHNLHFTSDSGVFSKHTVDFGSRTLLSVVPELKLVPGPLLDLGCGYGPIGLTLASYFSDRQIQMSDVNQRALDLAQKNTAQNQLKNVQIFASDGYENINTQFSAIFTNPPVRAGKKVVSAFLTGAKAHLLPGGQIVVVLQKKQGAPSAQKLLKQTFGNCEILTRNKGYYILHSTKTTEGVSQ